MTNKFQNGNAFADGRTRSCKKHIYKKKKRVPWTLILCQLRVDNTWLAHVSGLQPPVTTKPRQFPKHKGTKRYPSKKKKNKRQNRISLPFWWRVKSHWHKQIPLFCLHFLLWQLTNCACVLVFIFAFGSPGVFLWRVMLNNYWLICRHAAGNLIKVAWLTWPPACRWQSYRCLWWNVSEIYAQSPFKP